MFFQGLSSLTILLHAQTCTLLLVNCVDCRTSKQELLPTRVSLHKRCPWGRALTTWQLGRPCGRLARAIYLGDFLQCPYNEISCCAHSFVFVPTSNGDVSAFKGCSGSSVRIIPQSWRVIVSRFEDSTRHWVSARAQRKAGQIEETLKDDCYVQSRCVMSLTIRSISMVLVQCRAPGYYTTFV